MGIIFGEIASTACKVILSLAIGDYEANISNISFHHPCVRSEAV